MHAGEVGDLVLLSKISEEEIVSTLERRFKGNDIYTYIGSVLLSVNPFKNISGLYGPQQIRQYRGRYLYELPPHIYAIAECKPHDCLGLLLFARICWGCDMAIYNWIRWLWVIDSSECMHVACDTRLICFASNV